LELIDSNGFLECIQPDQLLNIQSIKIVTNGNPTSYDFDQIPSPDFMSLKIESSSISIKYVDSLLLSIAKMKNNVHTKIKTGQFNGLACNAIMN